MASPLGLLGRTQNAGAETGSTMPKWGWTHMGSNQAGATRLLARSLAIGVQRGALRAEHEVALRVRHVIP